MTQNQRSVFSVSAEPVPKTQFFEPEKLERCVGKCCELHGTHFALGIHITAVQQLRAYLWLVSAFQQAVSEAKYDTAKRIWKDLVQYTDDDVKVLEAMLE